MREVEEWIRNITTGDLADLSFILFFKERFPLLLPRLC